MLVITRRLNERIYVGKDVIIKVSQIEGKRVRLAIEAPIDTLIERAEIIESPDYQPNYRILKKQKEGQV